jgi:hypothetical protein
MNIHQINLYGFISQWQNIGWVQNESEVFVMRFLTLPNGKKTEYMKQFLPSALSLTILLKKIYRQYRMGRIDYL